MHRLRILLAGALALGLGACGGSSSTPLDQYAAATPTVSSLALETNGTSEAASSALTVADSAPSAQALSTTCQPYEYLCNIHAAIEGLNTYVRAAVLPIEALAQTTPTSVTADTKVFGPVDAPPAPATAVASFRLTVLKVADGFFRWKLEGKPLGTDDTHYVLVAGGAIHRAPGDLDHHGHGFLGIDLDNLYSLDSTPGTPWNGEGKLFVGFAHQGYAKQLLYVLSNFTPDRTQNPNTQNAVLAGWKNALGVARVRIVSVNDYVSPKPPATDTGAKELLLSRAVWFPGLGGRAVVAVGGGDVPSYGIDFFLGISCYDKTEGEVYRALYGCTIGVGCSVVQNAPAGYNTGSPSTCVLGTEMDIDAAHPPSSTPAADSIVSTLEPGGPAVVPDPPPSTMDGVKF